MPAPLYRVHLSLGNVAAGEIVVMALPLKGQHIEVLVGRDVLSRAVFIYTGHDDAFTLSF